MFLTRVPIDITHRKGLQFVGSPYRVHAAVEAAFSSEAKRADDRGRILWRLDEANGRTDCVWLYMLSPEIPDCRHIISQAGVPEGEEPETKCYDKVLDAVTLGSRWQFRLKANPVRKVLKDKGTRSNTNLLGSIQGHVTERQQRMWLLDRAAGNGFAIVPSSSGSEALSVSHRQKERFARGGAEVTITTVQYDGVLEVVDTEAFRHLLGFGMGRAKGFGCGLMTIAPVRTI